jgi:hypothetical protein
MFSNYVRGNVVDLNSGTWRMILCSDSVSNLTVSEVNPARGSTNITEVAAGGGYSTGGIQLTLANTSAANVFTFAADTAVHANGVLSWTDAVGSPTNIKSAVLIDDAATSPVDAAIGFYDMTEDGGTTSVNLEAVTINLTLGNNNGKIFDWTTG